MVLVGGLIVFGVHCRVRTTAVSDSVQAPSASSSQRTRKTTVSTPPPHPPAPDYGNPAYDAPAATSTRPPPPLRAANGSKFGYVLASSYFDQITGSMANFVSMQCWAASLGARLRVVEPFLVHSTYGVNLSEIASEGRVQDRTKLSDLFNKTEWTMMTSVFAPVVSWNFFLRDAPRRLILVDRGCIQRDDPLDKCEDCVSLIDSLKFSPSAETFARACGFAVVRRICIPATFTLAHKFKSVIYGPHDPSKVVVMFESWGGIQQAEYSIRMGISDLQECSRMNFYLNIPVSSKIADDAKRYVQKYIPTADYIAVMVRMQYIAMTYNDFYGLSREEIVSKLSVCFETITRKVTEMMIGYGIKSVLLTLDCRKQGSYYFQESTELGSILANSTGILYRMLYGDSSSLSQWDESFDAVARSKNPGYVATLQKYLASRGRCLLTVGTGSFQFMAETMYMNYHSQSGTSCMERIETCTL